MAGHSAIARWNSVACDISFLKILFCCIKFLNSKIRVIEKLEKDAPIHYNIIIWNTASKGGKLQSLISVQYKSSFYSGYRFLVAMHQDSGCCPPRLLAANRQADLHGWNRCRADESSTRSLLAKSDCCSGKSTPRFGWNKWLQADNHLCPNLLQAISSSLCLLYENRRFEV